MKRIFCFAALLINFFLWLPYAAAALPVPETIIGAEYEVKTSSVLNGKNKDYNPANMASFDPSKVWCEGNSSYGVGEWIELSLKEKPRSAVLRTIDLKVLPGYAATDQLYQANARPSRIVVEAFDRRTKQRVTGQSAYTFNLADAPFLQGFSLDIGLPSVDPSKIGIRIKIDDVFKGDKYEDMCITEIQVFLKERDRGILELRHEEWDAISSKEAGYLKEQLPKAERGDKKAMQGLIRLINGAYYTGAEGAEWLNEIYLDLLIKHPYPFLFLLARQESAVRNKVVEEGLLKPVSDQYSKKELLTAVKTAQKKGLNPPFLKKLIDFYSI
jgi:hypothetical protein